MWHLKETTKCQEEIVSKLLESTNFWYEFQAVKTADLISWPEALLHTVSSCLFSDTIKPSGASRAGLGVGPAGQLPWGPQLKGALKHHWNNRKYGASKLMFPHAKEFHRKLSAIWARAF